MSYFFKGDYEQAVQAFRESLERTPNQTKVYNNLGLALAKLGRYEEALKAFKQAGDEAKAYNNLGVLYVGQKQYQEAIAAFEKAIQLSPAYFTKAAENLKIARQALAEAPKVSETTAQGTISTRR
jgi:Flp pilus assembly protein TadD